MKSVIDVAARAIAPLALACTAIAFPGAAVSAEFRLGHVFANESPVGLHAQRFAELVRDRTQGEVTVKVFPSGQIGNDEQLMRDVSRGLTDFAFVNYGSATNLDRRIDFTAMPYIVTSYEQVDRIFHGNGVVPRTAIEMMSRLNIHFLGWFEQEFRAVSNSKRPVNAMADLKGLKLRVPPARVLRTFFDDAGVQTVTMPITELFTALQQRTVDGQENGPIQTYTAKLYENTRYMTLTNHAFVTGAIVMSKSMRDKLTPQQRTIVEETAREVSRTQIFAARAAYTDSIAKLRAAGVEVIELSPAARAELQKFGMGLWDKMADVYGADKIAELRREIAATMK